MALSLLSQNGISENGITVPESVLTDLNLDQVLDKVCEGWDEDVRTLYSSFPACREDEEYRRAIYEDVRSDSVYSAMFNYHAGIKSRLEYASKIENAYELVQKRVWFLRVIYTYVSSLETLDAELKKAAPKSEGLKAFSSFLSKYISDGYFKKLSLDATSLWKELCDFHVVLTYDRGQFTLKDGTAPGAYEKFLKELFPDQNRAFDNPFTDTEYYSDLEAEIVRLFTRKNKEFFKKLEAFCNEYPEVENRDLTVIEKEMVYYLAFVSFERNMKRQGYEMCMPSASDDKLSAENLYDLALAITNSELGKKVVPNALMLSGDESFFVLTGPNQGGKTTYGRSLGQLIWLSKMGFSVPADRANVPYFTDLCTHFSVEESADSGRGKLMDELERLKPIMDESKDGAFIVINELFTTAANFDAIEMGQRVLRKLISKKCKGIYVTHLGELAGTGEGVVSLIADVDENNNQTFEIRRSMPVDVNTVNRLVVKYRLTYDQLKERFS
ncbi:MAG: hypothetical protein J5696_01495 [Lachnospiraceae bacterium]|nr:hypothetical protein [Lachnospiraceae bacterium]